MQLTKEISQIECFDALWTTKLSNNGLYFQISCSNNNGSISTFAPYPITAGSFHYQPVFPFTQPIKVSEDLWGGKLRKLDFPLKFTIEILSIIPVNEFDMLNIYDEG